MGLNLDVPEKFMGGLEVSAGQSGGNGITNLCRARMVDIPSDPLANPGKSKGGEPWP